jgi:adenosine 3'-phospho 5'-phosphosulfate transporter B2
MSSWAQYKALNYVAFSMQTIFKSTKVIPIMFMGTILKGTSYSSIEYAEAVAITIGVATFGLNKESSHKSSSGGGADWGGGWSGEAVGFVLLCTYVLADSFTAQWQSKLYNQYGKIDQWHMMYGVNMSSIIITLTVLVLTGELYLSLEFLYYNPLCIWFQVLTAITSATGQIAIYTTIKLYGPIVFAVIMTTRQVFSIALSNLLFGHTMTLGGYTGAFVVFGAVFHSVYRKRLEKLSAGEEERGARPREAVLGRAEAAEGRDEGGRDVGDKAPLLAPALKV